MSLFRRLFSKASKPAISYANQFDIYFDTRDLEATLLFCVAPHRYTVSELPTAIHCFALNPFNAKRLHWALEQALNRHESTFGPLPDHPSLRRLAPLVNSSVGYVNSMQISSNPEELIIEFRLNPRPFDPNHNELVTACIIAMPHVVAKSLMATLGVRIAEYEDVNGTLELDVQKRIQN